MDFKSYKLLGFERGKGYKQYNAVLEDKKSKKKIIAFGDKRYEQYKDNVLGLYSHLDHNDIKRKKSPPPLILKGSNNTIDISYMRGQNQSL